MTTIPLIVTALYAGLTALLLVGLGAAIPTQRYRARVGLGDGGDQVLLRRVRAHGNLAEYLPTFLVLLAILELAALPFWLLHALGAAFTLGRILHALALYRGSGGSPVRAGAMALTWFPIAIAALACLWVAFAW